MTEQKAENPIDDLYRKTFEALPDTPANSGWDTPSDRVWQHVQANIQAPRKGWSMQSMLLLGIFMATLAAGLCWMYWPNAAQRPVLTPSTVPLEQPPASLSAPEMPGKQPSSMDTAPKTPSGGSKSKAPAPQNSADEGLAKPGENSAQPLPGSKPTLPPNTTEAKKKRGEQE